MPERPSAVPATDLESLLAALPAPLAAALESIRSLAPGLRQPVFLVGGLVRDLLLGRPARDLDLLIEGDALRWIRQLAVAVPGRLDEHPEFLTATLELSSGIVVDVASTRQESYERPADLPKVQPGDLECDLRRRDFTANAMAIRLWPPPAPVLEDPLGGSTDLSRGVLRVLHERSFIDDPTRLPRAVGLELRLGLRLDEGSLEAWEAARAARAVSALSGTRLRASLALLLGEPELVEGAVLRLLELGFLREISPDLAPTELTRHRLAEATAVLAKLSLGRADVAEVAWNLLTIELTPSARRHLARRLDLHGRDADRFVDAPSHVSAAVAQLGRDDLVPHQAADTLAALTPNERVVCRLVSEPARHWITRFEREWQSFRLTITGAELLRRGVTPGPRVGRALREVRAARIDGKITVDQELELALRLARQDRTDP